MAADSAGVCDSSKLHPVKTENAAVDKLGILFPFENLKQSKDELLFLFKFNQDFIKFECVLLIYSEPKASPCIKVL